jgi:hypothetical protein
MNLRWNLILQTDKYLYTIGTINKMYITGKYNLDYLPTTVFDYYNINYYLYSNKYTKNIYNYYLEKIKDNLVSYPPVLKTNKSFNCPDCNEISTFYTPLECLHIICDICVANLYLNKLSCKLCFYKPNFRFEKNEISNAFPYTHLMRLIHKIKLNDKSPIKYISTCTT